MAFSNKSLFYQQISGQRVPVNNLGNVQQLALAKIFITRAIAFAKTLDLNDFPITEFPDIPFEDLQTSGLDTITAAIFKIEQYLVALEADTFHERNAGGVQTVTLNETWRTTIRSKIEHIRIALDTADIEAKLKQSILNKLNAFSNEIERDRTRLDTGIEVWLEVTAAIGIGAKNLSPVAKLIQDCTAGLKNLHNEQQEDSKPKKLPSPDTMGLLEQKTKKASKKK